MKMIRRISAHAGTKNTVRRALFCQQCRYQHTGDGQIHQAKRNAFDVIVVGGGHAGCEAATAAARMGAQTLLLTHKIETIGEMSCNPSFGGIGKGHLVREVDALDGVCGRICDKAGIQFKVLNRRKGPAVWGLRAQMDRSLYRRYMQEEILNTKNLTVQASPVEDLIVEDSSSKDVDGVTCNKMCTGVVLENGNCVYAKSVVITTGTFLRGVIHLGLDIRPAGRIGDAPAVGLAKTLEDAGFTVGRLKTGTPPRLDGKTINYEVTQRNEGDRIPTPFSFMTDKVAIKPEDQVVCHVTNSTTKVGDIVINNKHLNHHIRETIQGPRYCPSIESKVLKFGNRPHQVWLEPEGLDTDVVYMQGFSITLPPDLQQQCVHHVIGLENAVMTRPGYGVEYDFMDPQQIKPSLETKRMSNLFFAGQINGTTGYEEAAAQGIIAGINATLRAQDRPPFIVSRAEGYIGVLIDDLTTQGTTEPYRMFTSRAEFRLTLRPDNADLRLTFKGYSVGCVSPKRYEKTKDISQRLQTSLEQLKDIRLPRSGWKKLLERVGLTSFVADSSGAHLSALDILQHPSIEVTHLAQMVPDKFEEDPAIAERLKIEGIYAPLLEQQLLEIEEVKAEEELLLPENMDFMSLSLSKEIKTKLQAARPTTIGAASRLQGMTPGALTTLFYHVRRLGKRQTT